jgi:hypothetical protein
VLKLLHAQYFIYVKEEDLGDVVAQPARKRA